VTVTLGLDGSGKVDVVAGGYEDWVRKRFEDHRPAKAATKPDSAAVSKNEVRGGPQRKLSYKDQRDFDRLPGEIERLEREIAAAEEKLHDPDLFSRDPALFTDLTERIARHRAEVEAAELRWLEVAELAEQLA
jgi:ATP-binding cassette subfamily F protein uup